MTEESLMPIREFSFLTGISRETLRFYDKVGLLSPQTRGENSYRYYSSHQLDLAYLIGDLRALGVGLEEIKRYADQRSPERMLSLFQEQNTHIEGEIERLHALQELMRLRGDMVREALRHSDGDVVLMVKEREPIFLCPPLSSAGPGPDLLVSSYDYAAAHGINASFPIGAILTLGGLESNGPAWPSQYYFKVRKSHNACKSAGTYAVFYRSMETEHQSSFYKPLLAFLQKNSLRAVGQAYGEYLLDELTRKDGEAFTLRVEVQVEGG